MGYRDQVDGRLGWRFDVSVPHRFQTQTSRGAGVVVRDVIQRPINILVVEDSDAVRAVLAMSLKIGKVPVGRLYQATQGLEALSILRSESIDLVFTDIHMPEMDGIELMEKMSSDRKFRDIPVVVISYKESPSNNERLARTNFQAYLPKPFTPDNVAKVIEDVLGEDKENALRRVC